MKARDLDRLNDAWRMAPSQTRWRTDVYGEQRCGRRVMPTARQLRRIVKKARRAGGGR